MYDILKDDIKGLFFKKYLLPSICATLVTSIYVLADTIMIGKGVGAHAIAALNIVLPIYSILFGTGLLLGIGGGVLMSVANGSGNHKKANSFFTLSVLCGIFFSIFYIMFGILFFKPIIFLLGGTEQNFLLIKEYLFPLLLLTPAFIFSSLLQAFVRNDKNPKKAMIAVICGGVTNIVLDYIFIFEFQWSMFGAVLATILGTILTDCILLSHFFSKKNTMQLTKQYLSFKSIFHIFSCGFSSFLTEISNGALIFFFNIQFLNYIGEIGVIVYSIISNCGIVAMSLFNGVSQASQPLIATNYGANQIKRVSLVSRLGTIVIIVIGCILFASGFFAPEFFISMFVEPTKEITKLGISAIRIYFIAFLFMGYNIFSATYFQSIVKPMYSFTISFLRGLIISGISVFLFPIIWGADSLWYVMPFTEIIVCFIAVLLSLKTIKNLSKIN